MSVVSNLYISKLRIWKIDQIKLDGRGRKDERPVWKNNRLYADFNYRPM